MHSLQPSGQRAAPLAHVVLVATLALVSAVVWYREANREPISGWDHAVYYGTAVALESGANPYARQETLAAMRNRGVPTGVAETQSNLYEFFAYPPFFIRGAAILTWAGDVETSRQAFLKAKLVAVALLIGIWLLVVPCWQRLSWPELGWLWLLAPVIVLYGWGRPIYVDLFAGNVTVFEQLLIWCGLAAFVRGRPLLFAFAIGTAASWKLMPLAFLVLLAWTWRDSPRGAAKAVAVALAACVVWHIASAAAEPATYRHYLGTLARMGGESRGQSNPSALALAGDVIDAVSGLAERHAAFAWTGGGVLEAVSRHRRRSAFALWCALAGVAWALFWLGYRRLGRQPASLLVTCHATLFLACVLPRFKIYSYMAVVPVAIYVVQAAPPWARLPLTALAVVGVPVSWFASGYAFYFGLWVYWLVFLGLLGPGSHWRHGAGFLGKAGEAALEISPAP